MPGKGGEEIGFSNIWVADSDAAEVLKVDTRTAEILAVYRTHENRIAAPSRTSVSLNGDLAVANRGGQPDGTAGQSGVTVVMSREDDCVDANGNGTIETSRGPDEVLGWGEDECVLWHRPFDARSNRPVAWTSGTYNEETCRWENTMLWTATNEGGPDDGGGPGPKGPDGPGGGETTDAHVYLLDGASGDIEGDVVIPTWDAVDERGVYGGAVDSNGDFWFIAASGHAFGHVALDDLSHEVLAMPTPTGYGVMVDSQDRIWAMNGTVVRYDPGSDTWAEGQCGCTQIAESPSGEFWSNALTQIDEDTLRATGAPLVDFPGEHPWGLAFDVDGFLWGVSFGHLTRFDTETGDQSSIYPESGFFYTYSDMTGWGLLNVSVTPEG